MAWEPKACFDYKTTQEVTSCRLFKAIAEQSKGYIKRDISICLCLRVLYGSAILVSRETNDMVESLVFPVIVHCVLPMILMYNSLNPLKSYAVEF